MVNGDRELGDLGHEREKIRGAFRLPFSSFNMFTWKLHLDSSLTVTCVERPDSYE